MNSFYYTLQSNASLDCYPSNTCTNFKVRLIQRMNLCGEWTVGLAEIHFPIKFEPRGEKRKNDGEDPDSKPTPAKLPAENNVESSKLKRSISLSESEIGPKLPPDQIITNLNKEVRVLSENVKKMKWNLKDVAEAKDEEIVRLKHLSDYWQHNFVSISNVIHKDVNYLNAKMHAPKYLYVYCSVAELEMVGDRYGPFLRVVRVPPMQMTGETQDKDWVNPHYKKVSSRNFDTLEVDIRDEKGRPVSFANGIVIVTLHFKKCA
jgi:hypothetical protein